VAAGDAMTNFRANLVLAFLSCWSAASLGADAPPPAQESSGAVLSNPLAAQLVDRLSATVDRPLFSPSRRPPAPPPPPVAQAPEPPPPPPPPPNLVLSGIVMDGEGARAVVRVGADAKTLRAQIGDDIGGWKVAQIEGRKLVLSLDGRFATFTLFNHEGDQRALVDGSASKVSDRSTYPSQQPQLKRDSDSTNQNPGSQRKRRRARE
jgi:general secretion pathway protein N